MRPPAMLRAVAGILLALTATVSSAALYKWTDANGRVVYSDQPPTGNVNYEVVGGAAPPSNPNAVRDMAAQEAEFRKRQTDKAEETAKAEKARAEATRRNELCMQARARVRLLQDEAQPLVRLNDKGERVLMTTEDRRRAIEEQQRVLRESCGG